jgi:nitric oxide reductase large subunit
MQKLRWMRAPGDTIFALGAAVLVAFVFTTRFRKAGQSNAQQLESKTLVGV